jgi:hypothetical protein
MPDGFKMDFKNLEKGLNLLDDKIDVAFRMFADTSAKKLETSAKENRPWTDRTSSARNRLEGSAYKVSKGYELRLAHGVSYGIWLELANEKNYAIIEPTIRLKSPEVLSGLEKLMDRLGK